MIESGQFQEFSFSARNPEEAGELAFQAIQTYEDGEEVRWTGALDSDTPASVVEIEAASEEGGAHHGGAEMTRVWLLCDDGEVAGQRGVFGLGAGLRVR